MSEETREVAVPVANTSYGTRQALDVELRAMRKAGFEVELCLRGSWFRRGAHSRRPTVLKDLVLDTWRLEGERLAALGNGMWIPAMRRTPPPEILLRGVRRSA